MPASMRKRPQSRGLCGLAFATALLVSWSGAAWSSLISITSASFSGHTSVLSYAPFDSTLGSLDRVDVSIQGFFRFNGFGSPNPAGPFGAPIPYPYTVKVDQDFSSFGMIPGFDFGTPGSFLISGVATGTGGPLLPAVRPFSYEFAFTESTDLIGFAIPVTSGVSIPPLPVNGSRDDFLKHPFIPELPINTLMTLSSTQLVGLPVMGMTTSANGHLFIQYRYTPFPTEPGPMPTISEPITLVLLALGLAGVGFAGKRQHVGMRRGEGTDLAR